MGKVKKRATKVKIKRSIRGDTVPVRVYDIAAKISDLFVHEAGSFEILFAAFDRFLTDYMMDDFFPPSAKEREKLLELIQRFKMMSKDGKILDRLFDKNTG